MASTISTRLDEKVRGTLAAETRLRRERIRAQSQAVGEYVTRSPGAAAFYADWGTPAPLPAMREEGGTRAEGAGG